MDAPEGDDDEPTGDEPEGEDAPEEEEELDLGEADHMETDHKEGQYREGQHDEADMDEVYEIDENMLRRALAMMTEDAAEEADQFGGGEALGDVILDIDEEDLINVLADEIGNTDVPATPPMIEFR